MSDDWCVSLHWENPNELDEMSEMHQKIEGNSSVYGGWLLMLPERIPAMDNAQITACVYTHTYTHT